MKGNAIVRILDYLCFAVFIVAVYIFYTEQIKSTWWYIALVSMLVSAAHFSFQMAIEEDDTDD